MPTSTATLVDDELVDIAWIAQRLGGMSVKAARRAVRSPGGPDCIEINERVHLWWRSEVHGWLESRRRKATPAAKASVFNEPSATRTSRTAGPSVAASTPRRVGRPRKHHAH